MARTSDPMTVELEPHRDWDDKATIPGWVDHNQYRVYVYSKGLLHRNEEGKLQVGWMGKQDGANFCPLPELDNFTPAHRIWIGDEAKRLHGSASTKPFVELPPPIQTDEGPES